MSYVIETNVPLPGNHSNTKPLTATIRALGVGESFVIPGGRPSHLGNIFGTQKPKKFVTRTIEGDTRVWRLE